MGVSSGSEEWSRDSTLKKFAVRGKRTRGLPEDMGWERLVNFYLKMEDTWKYLNTDGWEQSKDKLKIMERKEKIDGENTWGDWGVRMHDRLALDKKSLQVGGRKGKDCFQSINGIKVR